MIRKPKKKLHPITQYAQDIVKVIFKHAETAFRYIDDKSIDDIEWKNNLDRTKSPFIELAGKHRERG